MKIKIFTDGACSENPGPGGWAAVFYTDTQCKALKGYEFQTTNNRMELMAVVKAMEKIYKGYGKHPNVTLKNVYELYSDSAYVVNSINNLWVDTWRLNGWKTKRGEDIKNRDLWERFIKVRIELRSKGIILDIIKVKGHSGNAFNEYVDKLAKLEVQKAREKGGGRCAVY